MDHHVISLTPTPLADLGSMVGPTFAIIATVAAIIALYVWQFRPTGVPK